MDYKTYHTMPHRANALTFGQRFLFSPDRPRREFLQRPGPRPSGGLGQALSFREHPLRNAALSGLSLGLAAALLLFGLAPSGKPRQARPSAPDFAPVPHTALAQQPAQPVSVVAP